MNNNPEEVGTLGHLLVTVSISCLSYGLSLLMARTNLNRGKDVELLIGEDERKCKDKE